MDKRDYLNSLIEENEAQAKRRDNITVAVAVVFLAGLFVIGALTGGS